MKVMLTALLALGFGAFAHADSFHVYECGHLVNADGTVGVAESFKAWAIPSKTGYDVELLRTTATGGADVSRAVSVSHGVYAHEGMIVKLKKAGSHIAAIEISVDIETTHAKATCQPLPFD